MWQKYRTTVIGEQYTRPFSLYSKLEGFLKENTIALEREGYSLARLKKNITKGNTIFTQLEFDSEKQRRLNDCNKTDRRPAKALSPPDI
jgi:hypothetical protein